MSDEIKHDDFTVDKTNLYREETITDFKIATLKVLCPIHIDGTDDESRTRRYFGETQMVSPEGPIPVRSMLPATSLEEAVDAFPKAMEKALASLVEQVKQMQNKSKAGPGPKSRIIPGHGKISA
ncbi:MAG: cytoplasmic protein [Desulfobacter sp.]|nr:MAG: cytoplasmic protein [Desulfobacter sp.]